MPYRVDIRNPPDDALDRLVQLGALDVELVPDGVAAILPDRVAAGEVAAAFGGAPESLGGAWPLVVANVRAAPLIEMAPALVRRVAHAGRLILSGIPWSVRPDVEQTYRRLGLHAVVSQTRAGWTVLVLAPSW